MKKDKNYRNDYVIKLPEIEKTLEFAALKYYDINECFYKLRKKVWDALWMEDFYPEDDRKRETFIEEGLHYAKKMVRDMKNLDNVLFMRLYDIVLSCDMLMIEYNVVKKKHKKYLYIFAESYKKEAPYFTADTYIPLDPKRCNYDNFVDGEEYFNALEELNERDVARDSNYWGRTITRRLEEITRKLERGNK